MIEKPLFSICRWVIGFFAKLLGLLFITFLLFHLGGADPARLKLGPMATEDAVQRERSAMGLDRPLAGQFTSFVASAARGDMGTSFRTSSSALALAWSRFGTTMLLVLGALVPALAVSYGLALAAHLNPRYGPPLILLPARSLAVLPSFVVAVGGLLSLSLLDVSLWAGSGKWIACILLALFPTASLTLLLHDATSRGAAPRSWIAARALGFSPITAYHRALFSPASLPWITVWITQLSQALFTAMTLELVLTIDGAGSLLATAVQQRDLPVLRSILLINGAIFLVLHSSLAGLSKWLDPRLNTSASISK